jgi:hypothetical protein
MRLSTGLARARRPPYGKRMPEYRIYILSDGGQISGPPIEFDCSNDTEAVAWAELAIEERGSDIELWQHTRFVIRLNAIEKWELIRREPGRR